MVKAVIFDLDGLLVNTEVTWYMVFKDMLASCGHSMTLEEYLEEFSGKTIAQNIQGVNAKYHMNIDPQSGVEKAVTYEQEYLKKGVDLKKGARELLQYLKENGYKIVLGSSSTKQRAVMILESHNLLHYFDDFACGDEVKRGKPYPDIFLLASKKAGIKSEDCLVLEDSEAGIQAAYAANIPVICIPDMKKPREKYVAMTVEVLDSMLDVMDYLKSDKK